MEGPTKSVTVLPEAFVASMRGETEQMLREVIEAVNDAPDGYWINASEGRVRDVMGEYRRRVYEAALQMKTDVAEGAFSPDRSGVGRTSQKQGA